MESAAIDSTQDMIRHTEESVIGIIKEAIYNGIESNIVEESLDDISKFIDAARMSTDSYNPYDIARATIKMWKKHIKENAGFITNEIDKLEGK
jgi:hypothetical protein